MPRTIPTQPGRWYGRWNRYPWRWFDVYELKTSHGTFLVTDQLDSEEGGTWYVNHGAFEWKEEVMNLTNKQIEDLRDYAVGRTLVSFDPIEKEQSEKFVVLCDEVLRLRKLLAEYDAAQAALNELWVREDGTPEYRASESRRNSARKALNNEARRCRGLEEPK